MKGYLVSKFVLQPQNWNEGFHHDEVDSNYKKELECLIHVFVEHYYIFIKYSLWYFYISF